MKAVLSSIFGILLPIAILIYLFAQFGLIARFLPSADVGRTTRWTEHERSSIPAPHP